MRGLMQDWPLRCSKVLDHAAAVHGDRAIVSRSLEGPLHRTDWRAFRGRSLKLAQWFSRYGLKRGDRVATLAWNTARHLEVWYGAMGAGGVYHTLNPRLFADQLVHIVNHAEDRLVFADACFAPLLEKLSPRLPTVEAYVFLTDAEHMPETSLKGAAPYEELLAETDGDFEWLEGDENEAAGMCYTSGTTGDPKGVVYSHRSNVLHAMGVLGPDCFGLSSRDVVLPVVPLFHANGWGLGIAGPMAGCALVMPGPRLDGASVHQLLDDEGVTCTAAVPTVWLGLLDHLEKTGGRLKTLKRVVIGGAACPRKVAQAFQDTYGVEVIHAWGMTETSPLGTLCSIKPAFAHLTGDEKLDLQASPGHPPFGVELAIADDEGTRLPHDGAAVGRLKVRGVWTAASYFKSGADVLDQDGFFDTGDVGTVDPHGYLRITDRSKDVIKSGGEWISSIALENIAMGHPKVFEAAVIGVAHEKWDERPLLVVVPKPGEPPTREELIAWFEGKIAKWWTPDDVAFVEQLPHTAAGKVSKLTLREQMKGRPSSGGPDTS